ncbi:unnamed protein product [Pieris macdunnoughi]|uniref:Carboxylic ester hydrolase n=1 Tax=Pieris macdunnoughi TaxID=345717 RepID=A0A821VVM7_9NEOP|nr:unnamed protein product [Pieris macdunnoughi]
MWSRVFILCACVCAYSESRVVNTAQGPVKGYQDGSGLYIFYNIPYAKAPTGKDRFKAPLPATNRSYVLEAINKGIVCPQSTELFSMYNETITITEDCLIANIFVPDTKKTSLPVIVYVHGGAFILGQGNFLTYKQFAKTNDIIVVTFNYRLGAHGFLCMGTDDIPGNAGMKDQVALLRWVKENIANFGGDSDDVTIAGYSAGSVAVDLLMLSDMAKGLFNKVIPESGANTVAWGVQTDPMKNAKEYGKLLNFTVDDVYSLEEFYKTVSYEILTSKQFDLFSRPDSTFLLSPCVERNTEGEEFLIDSPVNILKSGRYNKVPILYGFANMEGLLRTNLFEEWKNKMNEDFTEFLPPDLQFNSEEEKKIVANKIKEFYFGGKVTDENTLSYVDFFSDVLFTYSTLRAVKLHLEAGHDKIYLYEYVFVDDDVPVVLHTNVRGATHCAQSVGVGDGNFTHADDEPFSPETREMKKIVRELWSNFVKTGLPVPEGSNFPSWPPVGKGWSPHMELNNPLQLKGSLLKERTLFWDEIYEKYYRHPSPPQNIAKRFEL